MSEDDNFLARWSRRKRQAEHDSDARSGEQVASDRPGASGVPRNEKAEDVRRDSRLHGSEREESPQSDKELPEFDASTLPPLDSIGPGTDIRAFLARGVPAALTRAALSRAWTSDPAIRDFIGLSENAWDFTAPGGVPGFGPLDVAGTAPPADLVRSAGETGAQQSFSKPESAASPSMEPEAESSEVALLPQPSQGPHAVVNEGVQPSPDPALPAKREDDRTADKQNEDVAAQEVSNSSDPAAVLPRRRHGGALPG